MDDPGFIPARKQPARVEFNPDKAGLPVRFLSKSAAQHCKPHLSLAPTPTNWLRHLILWKSVFVVVQLAYNFRFNHL